MKGACKVLAGPKGAALGMVVPTLPTQMQCDAHGPCVQTAGFRSGSPMGVGLPGAVAERARKKRDVPTGRAMHAAIACGRHGPWSGLGIRLLRGAQHLRHAALTLRRFHPRQERVHPCTEDPGLREQVPEFGLLSEQLVLQPSCHLPGPDRDCKI